MCVLDAVATYFKCSVKKKHLSKYKYSIYACIIIRTIILENSSLQHEDARARVIGAFGLQIWQQQCQVMARYTISAAALGCLGKWECVAGRGRAFTLSPPSLYCFLFKFGSGVRISHVTQACRQDGARKAVRCENRMTVWRASVDALRYRYFIITYAFVLLLWGEHDYDLTGVWEGFLIF